MLINKIHKKNRGILILKKKNNLEVGRLHWITFPRLLHINIERPKLFKSEVKSALSKFIRDKSAGPDQIRINIMTALVDFSIEKIKYITSSIFNSDDRYTGKPT